SLKTSRRFVRSSVADAEASVGAAPFGSGAVGSCLRTSPSIVPGSATVVPAGAVEAAVVADEEELEPDDPQPPASSAQQTSRAAITANISAQAASQCGCGHHPVRVMLSRDPQPLRACAATDTRAACRGRRV